jgi:hypothetical protein
MVTGVFMAGNRGPATAKLGSQSVSFLPDLSFQRLLYQFCAAIVVLTAHGYFLALAARLLGDRGPQYDGRLTLNPFRHTEPVGALIMIATQLGWVRPVVLEPDVLVGKRIGPLLVALGALSGSIALGWCCWQSRPLVFSAIGGGSAALTLMGLLETTARASLSFVIINLIPILPLSAGHLWLSIAPPVGAMMNRYRLPLALGLALVILLGLGSFVRGLVLGPLAGLFA